MKIFQNNPSGGYWNIELRDTERPGVVERILVRGRREALFNEILGAVQTAYELGLVEGAKDGDTNAEYLYTTWNERDECMVTEYSSRRRIIDRVGIGDASSLFAWLNTDPQVGWVFQGRSCTIVRVK